MKGVIGFVALALLLVAAGVIFVSVSRLEGRLADAHEQAATLQFDQAQQSVEAATGYAGYTDWVPALGDEFRQEIRVRQASLQYWQRQYDALVAEPPPAADSEFLVDLQLVVANAAFRAGQARAANRAELLEALDDAVARYATVLRNGTWRRDAAFNYEYSARLRDEIAKGRAKAPPVSEKEETDLGIQGGPSPAAKQRFEIYIPLENGESSPAGGDAAKAPPGARKG
jgi:hypothetical protein